MKYQKLTHQEIYTYDKDNGFTIYNPLSYKYNGYTIDKLFQTVQHQREKIEALENRLAEIEAWSINEGVHINELTKQNLLTQFDKIYLLDMSSEGYVLKVRKLSTQNVLFKEGIHIPQDVETTLYKLNKGGLEKDKEKEERLWSVL